MRKAEQFQQLAKEQYGSRKSHQAISQALNKRLTADIAMLCKISTIFCSQDAMSCYDRIAHAALAMGLRRQNLPETAIEMLITTIQKMVHRVRTVFGDSDLSYGGSEQTVSPQGIPQGNGMGPPGWGVISSPCLEVLRSKGFGAKLVSPITRQVIKFVGYAYVDDTDQVETEFCEGEDIDAIIARAQQAIDTWEACIKATGGAIRPEKCHWYLLDFIWEGSQWKLASALDSPGTLTVQDTNNQRHTISRKDPSDSAITLGVHCSPNGMMHHQVDRMTAQSKDWGDKITAGVLDRASVAVALNMTIWKTLGYPLSATLLSKNECEDIMRPALQAALPKMGFNRNMPRAVVFGPKAYQGLEIRHLFTVQGIAHLKDIISHQLQNDLTAALHRCSFEALFLLTGLNDKFLSRSVPGADDDLPRTLASCVRDFCISEQIELVTDIVAPILREHDVFLMSAFLNNQYNDNDRRVVNRCRLYLKVLTLAEIVSGDGKEILHSSWTGEITTDSLRDYVWPHQGRPTEREWTIWRRCLSKAFCSRNRLLQRPLGKWTIPSSTGWLFDPIDDSLYYLPSPGSNTQRWLPQDRRRRGRHRSYRPSSLIASPAQHCHRAICERHGSSIFFTGSCSHLSSAKPSPITPTTIMDTSFLDGLPPPLK